MGFGDAYIQPMLNRFGVSVTIGAVTAKCLRNEVDVNTLGDEWAPLAGKSIVVECVSGTFPALAVGVAMTVDGVAMHAARVNAKGPTGTTLILAVRVK